MYTFITSAMNGVPVARHGPILRKSEATPSGKLFKHLPGPPAPVFGPKRAQQSKLKQKTNLFVKNHL